MNTSEIFPAEMEATAYCLESDALEFPAQARAIKIVDNKSYDLACEIIKAAKAKEKEVVALFAEPKDRAHKAHKSITALEAKLLAPIKEALTSLDREISRWRREQELERQRVIEEQRRAAIKAAEDEKLRLAIAAEAAGKREMAEKIISAPVLPVFTPPPPPAPAANGVGSRENWKFSVANEALIPREYMTPDEKKIGQIVRAMKGATNIPGVEVYDAGGTVVRAGR